jgi:hypothetical protein
LSVSFSRFVPALERFVLAHQGIEFGAHAELLRHEARDLLLGHGPRGRPGRVLGHVRGFPVPVLALSGWLFHAFTP